MYGRASTASRQGLVGLAGRNVWGPPTNAYVNSLALVCGGTPWLWTHGSAPASTRSVSQLAFEEVTAGASTPENPTASPDRTLFVLHGLLGCGRNWRSWAKRLVEGAAAAAPAGGGPWRALLVDLRCHGASARRPGLNPPHNMATAAEDVARLVYEQCGHQPPAAILGHSMGGKVALALLELTRARRTAAATAAAAAPAAAATATAAGNARTPAGSGAVGAADGGRAGGRVVGLTSGGPRDPTPRSSAFAPFTTSTSHTAAAAAAAAASPSAASAAAAAAAASQHRHPHHHHDDEQGPTCAPPRQLWVLDSQPGLVAAEQDAGTGVSRVLQTVHSVPLPIPNRAWLLKRLRETGLSDALATWLASNLAPLHQQPPAPAHHHGGHHHQGHGGAAGSGPLTWTFDIAGAGAMYMSYRTTQFWHTLEQPPPGTAIHLVRGGRSDRWPEDQQRRLQQALAHAQQAAAAAAGTARAVGAVGAAAAGTFDLHVLPQAGHWLHVDDPNGLLQLVLPRLVAGRQ